MSLLEDVFLENEAGEAQELERIIEGDEFDERPRARSDSDDNSAKDDEAEEDKRRVDPTSEKPKRVIKNPRFVLNPARLTGPRGIQVVTEHFKDFKFKGKGHESEDLDLVLKKLEHWAYRLYPKFQFEDCLKKIETLGKKRAVSVHLHKIRTDQITSEETVVQKDSSDDETTPVQAPEEDEFDKLLQQQIEIARATPAQTSVKKTPFSERSSTMPKATSSPSINDEQRERMLKNRRMAEERRLARLKQNSSQENPTHKENGVSTSPISNDVSMKKRPNNSVNDSSDEDVMMNKNATATHNSNKSDTIELDDDGMIVTKSPKCYVPAKRRNKSRIDHSEEVENKSVTNDSINIVELDNDGQVETKSPKSYIPAKKHSKSIINSSDDDDGALVINKPTTIDVDKHHNDSLKKSSKNIANKSTVMDNSSNDDLVIREPVTVDVDKHHNDSLVTSSKNKSNFNQMASSDDEPITLDVENHHIDAKKHNRSNIIDSSESEDDAVVMNESITVDIHNFNESVTRDSNKPDSNKNDSIFDSLRTKAIKDNNDIMVHCDDTEIQSENLSINESCIASNDGKNCSVEVPIAETAIENDSETNITDQIEVGNEQKALETENDDDIMDVDFSDDF